VDGCMTVDDDGVRDLYIGNLAGIDAGLIGQGFDYLALGHLHRPEKIRGNPLHRYSGSPMPMGFGEAGQNKQVVIIEFQENQPPLTREISIETYRELRIINGDIKTIIEELDLLRRANRPYMVEVSVESESVTPLIQAQIREKVENSKVDIVKIRRKFARNPEEPSDPDITLSDLDEMDVFSRCLDEEEIPEEKRKDLIEAYCEILALVHEEDIQAD
jgi:DNA repair protein SbcD/Mre11